MNLLFTLYLKSDVEANFFLQHSLPSFWEDGNRLWELPDLKIRFCIYAEKHVCDATIKSRHFTKMPGNVVVNFQDTHPLDDKPYWFYETAYFKHATTAYGEFIDQQWWCPLKGNVVYESNSWNTIVDYMRAGAMMGLLSKPMKLNLATLNFNKKYASEFDLSDSDTHGVINSRYFNIQKSDGVLYWPIKDAGFLQVSFKKWPVAIKCRRAIMPVLHGMDKDFLQMYFGPDDWMKHLEHEEFGWWEYELEEKKSVEITHTDGMNSIEDQILRWCTNGFNCHPVHQLIAQQSVPILYGKLRSDEQRNSLIHVMKEAEELIRRVQS